MIAGDPSIRLRDIPLIVIVGPFYGAYLLGRFVLERWNKPVVDEAAHEPAVRSEEVIVLDRVRALSTNKRLQATQREIAEATGVPLAKVNRAINHAKVTNVATVETGKGRNAKTTIRFH